MKKQLIPSFNALADNNFEGMHFKDEGSYLAVSFVRSTGKPAGKAFYPFGEIVTLAINRAVIKSLNQEENPIQAMHVFFQRRLKEKVG